MPEQEGNRQVIATIGQRMTGAFTRTVNDEMARAAKTGVPARTLLQGALSALLHMSAVVAGNLISPETALNREQVQPRIDRLHIAFSQALHRIMEGESAALERKGRA